MIPERLLRKFKAKVTEYKKGSVIFQEGMSATHFHIVKSGRVKMVNCSEEGREFVQGYFTDGQSFGEPPFFTHTPYPASAVAMAACSVWHCPHDDFLELLKHHPDVHLKLTQVLCGRLAYKAMMLSEIAINEAQHRIMTVIRYFAECSGIRPGHSYFLPFTRQQLADMTGLRVETVIRSVRALAHARVLAIGTGGRIEFRIPRNKHGG
jgi:CRP-like cAMP-binding protein